MVVDHEQPDPDIIQAIEGALESGEYGQLVDARQKLAVKPPRNPRDRMAARAFIAELGRSMESYARRAGISRGEFEKLCEAEARRRSGRSMAPAPARHITERSELERRRDIAVAREIRIRSLSYKLAAERKALAQDHAWLRRHGAKPLVSA